LLAVGVAQLRLGIAGSVTKFSGRGTNVVLLISFGWR
jgi:hypothetical protein